MPLGTGCMRCRSTPTAHTNKEFVSSWWPTEERSQQEALLKNGAVIAQAGTQPYKSGPPSVLHWKSLSWVIWSRSASHLSRSRGKQEQPRDWWEKKAEWTGTETKWWTMTFRCTDAFPALILASLVRAQLCKWGPVCFNIPQHKSPFHPSHDQYLLGPMGLEEVNPSPHLPL